MSARNFDMAQTPHFCPVPLSTGAGKSAPAPLPVEAMASARLARSMTCWASKRYQTQVRRRRQGHCRCLAAQRQQSGRRCRDSNAGAPSFASSAVRLYPTIPGAPRQGHYHVLTNGLYRLIGDVGTTRYGIGAGPDRTRIGVDGGGPHAAQPASSCLMVREERASPADRHGPLCRSTTTGTRIRPLGT